MSAAVARKEVLILDDDPDLRNMLRKILEGAGMVVIEASKVAHAIKAMKERMPHLVILDLMLLDNETGVQFLEDRRKDAALAAVPVVVLSASKDKGMIYRALSLGAKDYLPKPLNATLILQKVRKSLAMDATFAKVEFDAGRRPEVHMVVPCRLVQVGEGGVLVEAPLKVDRASSIQVRAPLFDEIGASKAVTKPSRRRAMPSTAAPGQYQTHFTFFGITETIAARVRKVVKGWTKVKA